MAHACRGCLLDAEGRGATCSYVLGGLFIMTGMCRVVADDDATLLWWRHIRAMVSLVVFLTSGGSERWRWTARLGSFSVVGRYGNSILPVACIPPSSF